METMHHDPVMVKEVLETLDLRPGQVVIDGTLGLAGHSSLFCEKVRPGGTLIAFDWDREMLKEAERRLERFQDVEKILVNADFRTMADIVKSQGVEASGILLDLGLNSAQVEDPERGIAFKNEGPLDMRMDRTHGEPASALLNRLSPTEIERILWEYGDERWAKMIAKRIVDRRRERPLKTTTDLVEVVMDSIPPKARDKRIHPATRTFQAVRIAVNGELEGLDQALLDAAGLLAPGGTLVVLSYHSGEDRVAKHVFRALTEDGFVELSRKPVEPSAEEIARNPRSRSAKLRALRRP